MKRFLLITIGISSIIISKAQTINDGLMMPKKNFCTGFMFGHDRWKEYWEGEHKRDNQNIGKLTTTSITYMGNYGITNKLNAIVMVPYIKTEASRGTMTGLKGIQDLTLALKYNLLRKESEKGTFKAFAVGAFSTPLSDYTPDYLPLSIGLATTNLSYRGTLNYLFKYGLYINGSASYTWRSNTKLDRIAYYTDGELYNTNEVKMPNVFDYSVSVGFIRKGVETKLSYIQQSTLGGGDIRKQDMPFVSNKMNFNRVEGLVMYYLPKLKYLALRASAARTLEGRNVGQSTTLMAGLMYTFQFEKQPSSL